MLRLCEVSKQVHDQSILQNVTFEVTKGSVVGLAGSSGSGKTTLLRCIQKLERIDSGKIEYDEGSIGFMFQDFQLFPHMTVLENLTYAPRLVLKDKHAELKAFDLLEQLGLKRKAHHFPVQLSGGQKQRVALARSLMMHPTLLLCDEPTSGLDVKAIQEVVKLLQRVHEMGVTMLIASHDLDFLSQIVGRIILLKRGVIATDMTLSKFSQPIEELKKLY